MLDEALLFLKNQLNSYLRSGATPTEAGEEAVAFIDDERMEPLIFKLNAVSLLLINLEEEHVTRTPDLYRRTAANGEQHRVQPEIRLNLYVLFVARFKEYQNSLRYLSRIIRYFQSQRVFDAQNAPSLPDGIDQLVLELTTLPFAEQNEVWNALRTTYHPSLLYKVKMVVFQEEGTLPQPGVSALNIETRSGR